MPSTTKNVTIMAEQMVAKTIVQKIGFIPRDRVRICQCAAILSNICNIILSILSGLQFSVECLNSKEVFALQNDCSYWDCRHFIFSFKYDKKWQNFFINNASLSKTFDAFENLKTIQHFRKEYVTFMLQGSFISLFLLPLFNFS